MVLNAELGVFTDCLITIYQHVVWMLVIDRKQKRFGEGSESVLSDDNYDKHKIFDVNLIEYSFRYTLL